MKGRRLVAAAATTAAVLLAVPGTALAAANHPTGRGEQGPHHVTTADRVPWAQVGRGWYLTLIDQGTAGEYGIAAQHQILDLVDPRGGRYQLLKTDVADDGRGDRRLTDWSADGRRALLVVDSGTTHARAVVRHLREGTRRTVRLGRDVTTAHLGPQGSVYVIRAGGETGGALLRIDPDGTREVLMHHADDVALPSPGGRRIVVAPAAYHDHTFRFLDSDGVLVRTLALPHKCSPSRWWSARTVLATCDTHTGVSRLYAVPVDGTAPTAVSARHGHASPDLGDLDARSLGGTTYLEAAGPCGVVFLARQHHDGSAAALHLPGSTGNVYLLGTRGERLVLQTGISCDGGAVRNAIVRFDPDTRALRVVADLPADEAYGTILAFGERRTSFG